MAIKYEEVVPWGRNFDEYCRMFDLTQDDLKQKILGCGDGPASFNAICNSRGGSVVSVDPIYSLSREQISQRIKKTFDIVISQTAVNRDKFNWDRIRSVEELGAVRMAAMNEFLDTYEEGKAAGRYVAGSLPQLDFKDNSFDLALSSHFLFLHSDNLSLQFHYESIREMLRIARDVRIFPILDVNVNRSAYVDKIFGEFESFHIEIRRVDYEFQIGGNEMMVISK